MAIAFLFFSVLSPRVWADDMAQAPPPSAPYIRASTWTGVKRGYVFSKGDLGTGYYKDDSVLSSAAHLAAVAALAPAAAPEAPTTEARAVDGTPASTAMAGTAHNDRAGPAPEAHDWVKFVDPDSDTPYFHCFLTGQSSWEEPGEGAREPTDKDFERLANQPKGRGDTAASLAEVGGAAAGRSFPGGVGFWPSYSIQ